MSARGMRSKAKLRQSHERTREPFTTWRDNYLEAEGEIREALAEIGRDNGWLVGSEIIDPTLPPAERGAAAFNAAIRAQAGRS
jgi:hypothetical protein